MTATDNLNKIVIGVYGGSGSGKTTICKLLEKELGFHLIDADKIGHNVLEENVLQISKYFPSCIVKGKVSRKKLGEIVFNDDSKLKLLESITHTKILQKIESEISNCSTNILVDGAIINKNEFIHLIQLRVLVSCDRIIRVERLVNKRKIDLKKAEKMVDLFKGSDYDIFIDTTFGVDSIRKDLIELFSRYTKEK